MKFFILTKRKMLTICACLLVCGLAVTFSIKSMQVIQTANGRKVPIYSVQTADKQVALSFNCSSGNEQTGELIQILKQYQLQSTFFVVGDWVDEYPQSVKSLADAGHEIGNLGNKYVRIPQLSQADMMSELGKCNNKIKKITGIAPTLFRPPYGDYNNLLLDTVEELGMKTIQWDVDSFDEHDIPVEEMISKVMSDVRSGSIIIVHNGSLIIPQALPKIIEALQSEGYEIVPVSQLIRSGSNAI